MTGFVRLHNGQTDSIVALAYPRFSLAFTNLADSIILLLCRHRKTNTLDLLHTGKTFLLSLSISLSKLLYTTGEPMFVGTTQMIREFRERGPIMVWKHSLRTTAFGCYGGGDDANDDDQGEEVKEE